MYFKNRSYCPIKQQRIIRINVIVGNDVLELEFLFALQAIVFHWLVVIATLFQENTEQIFRFLSYRYLKFIIQKINL